MDIIAESDSWDRRRIAVFVRSQKWKVTTRSTAWDTSNEMILYKLYEVESNPAKHYNAGGNSLALLII